ncbi:hypothetical protein ZWY2020_036643, partial [Hordeum vulgare]
MVGMRGRGAEDEEGGVAAEAEAAEHGEERGRDRAAGVDREEARPRIGPGVVYLEDCWKPCLDDIHPAWLLAFRLVSFLLMDSVIIYDVIVDGWTVFLYYTQWTFLLVTLYFGLGSVLSVYGCYQYACKTDKSDANHGSYIIAPTEESTYNNSIKSSCLNKTHDGREIAGFWGYLFQIMFQVTRMVFWFILYPFLAWNQYQMSFLNVHVYALLIILQQKFGEIINDTSLPSVAAFRHFGRGGFGTVYKVWLWFRWVVYFLSDELLSGSGIWVALMTSVFPFLR